MSDEKLNTDSDQTASESSSKNLSDGGQNEFDENKKDDQSEPDEDKKENRGENQQNSNVGNDLEEPAIEDQPTDSNLGLEDGEDDGDLILEDIDIPNDEFDGEDAGNGGKKKWILSKDIKSIAIP